MAGRRPTNARERRARVEQDRARTHSARSQWHKGVIARRVRDNTVAAVAGAVIVVSAIVSQAFHAQATMPEPAPSVSPTPSPVAQPTEHGTPTPAP
ncbi:MULTISPECIES: hypothetical protein [Bacteria]|uniref:hypothetical protein n=1 Tax=Bacteria TaxID=2 RepID=UPI003C79796C